MLFSGRSNPKLAESIAKSLGKDLSLITIADFEDGEIDVEVCDSVRGSNVFVVQSTSNPSARNLMELFIMLDALKRASAKTITAIIPYFGYARQDRRSSLRKSIAAKLVAGLVERAGATEVLSVDFHTDQIEGFFEIHAENLSAMFVFAEYIKSKKLDNIVVVAPDVGGSKRVQKFADLMNINNIAIIDKKRSSPGQSKVMNVIGDVDGQIAILFDDIIDTAGTISNAAKALKEKGAVDVIVCATHAVLSKKAIKNLSIDEISEVVMTDTIQLRDHNTIDKITRLSIAPHIAEVVRCIMEGGSVEKMIKNKYDLFKK